MSGVSGNIADGDQATLAFAPAMMPAGVRPAPVNDAPVARAAGARVPQPTNDVPPLALPRIHARDELLCRLCDIVVATVALLFLLPLFAVIALIIKIVDPGPIFFAHRRLGRNGRSFPCLKFRTMVVDAEDRLRRLLEGSPDARREWECDHKLKDDPRVTRFGRFLRQTSLDELPQLLGVIIGQMSLVGPRPIVTGEIARYGRYYDDYCQLRPGITGLWQISGRNDVSYARRVACDVLYRRRRSFALHLYILVMTIPNVLLQRGSY